MEEAMRKSLKAKKARLSRIDEELSSTGVQADKNALRELYKERAELAPLVGLFERYLKIETDLREAEALSSDAELAELGRAEAEKLKVSEQECLEKLRRELIPKDPSDGKNAIVEIRGAAGGDEADIWAGDLFRMYSRYAESRGWSVKMIDASPSEAGGYSYVSFMVKGRGAYGRFKFESGAHRVQRVPRTEAAGRIHTSTATVAVFPEVAAIEVELKSEDIQVDTYRAQGAGGQYVNKTESAVRMTHIPTGVVATCQSEKSQIQNRETCLELLRAKIHAKLEEERESRIGSERRKKVGTGERSEKIRTYNYPQNRVSDHRIGLTLQKLDRVMEGELDELLDALIRHDEQEKLKNA